MITALTIAGSDSCSGAGIQADLKTFSSLEVYGLTAITAITAQNTQNIADIEGVSTSLIRQQLEVLSEDIKIDAVKIGMLYNLETVNEVIRFLSRNSNIKNIVLDPLIISSSGKKLQEVDAIERMKQALFPLVDLVTPNLNEATYFTSRKIEGIKDVYEACIDFIELGCKNVLIKGGHFEYQAIDILYDGERFSEFTYPKIDQVHTHGTGCTLSAAIAAFLAKGLKIEEAIYQSKAYITNTIKGGFSIGNGPGVLQHFWSLYNKENIKDFFQESKPDHNKPLIHFLTNYVTMNDVANVAIALGASPMMAEAEEELEEILTKAKFCVVNTGTADDKRFEKIARTMKYANQKGVPLLLDPVGCGASTYRKERINRLLSLYNVNILKVNGSEGKALLLSESNSIGVDSEVLTKEKAREIASALSKQYKCIAIVTGEMDYVADKGIVKEVNGGSWWLQNIIGTGCIVNSIIAAVIVKEGYHLEAVIKGLNLMKKAAEIARDKMGQNDGPMTFRNNLIDAIYYLRNKNDEQIKENENDLYNTDGCSKKGYYN